MSWPHGQSTMHDQLSIDQIVNCLANELASEAIVAGVATQSFINDTYNFETTRLMVKGVTVTGSPKTAITHSLPEYSAKSGLSSGLLGGHGYSLKSFLEMFQEWITL
jgi:hypothetical protein